MNRKRILAIALFSLAACNGPAGSGPGNMSPGTDNPGGSGDPGKPPPPPDPQAGLQVSSPEFELKPGEELFRCYYTTLPNDAAIAATQLKSWMAKGSHHFIVYTTNSPLRPDGTLEDCSKRQGVTSLGNLPVWLFSSQDQEAQLDMPEGVALPLKAHQTLFFDMHYINTTDHVMKVNVSLNLAYATGTFQKAGAFVTYQDQIKFPKGGSGTFGGDCAVPSGANFFLMSTHSHKRTMEAVAAKTLNGQMGQPIVDTTDWEHAAVSRFTAAPFLNFAAGEKLHYECHYQDTFADSPDVITVGESAAKNEMCMAIGYYFPADKTVMCLNSFTFNN